MRTLATSDAGAIPYYSDWYTIDFSGLNNYKIMQLGLDPTDCILQQKPTLLILISADGKWPIINPTGVILRTEELYKFYDFIESIKFSGDFYYNVYIIKEVDNSIRDKIISEVKLVSETSRMKNPTVNSINEKMDWVINRLFSRIGINRSIN